MNLAQHGGAMCKMPHHQFNANSKQKKSSTMFILREFYPKIMYHMLQLELGCTTYNQGKKMGQICLNSNGFELNRKKKKGGERLLGWIRAIWPKPALDLAQLRTQARRRLGPSPSARVAKEKK